LAAVEATAWGMDGTVIWASRAEGRLERTGTSDAAGEGGVTACAGKDTGSTLATAGVLAAAGVLALTACARAGACLGAGLRTALETPLAVPFAAACTAALALVFTALLAVLLPVFLVAEAAVCGRTVIGLAALLGIFWLAAAADLADGALAAADGLLGALAALTVLTEGLAAVDLALTTGLAWAVTALPLATADAVLTGAVLGLAGDGVDTFLDGAATFTAALAVLRVAFLAGVFTSCLLAGLAVGTADLGALMAEEPMRGRVAPAVGPSGAGPQ